MSPFADDPPGQAATALAGAFVGFLEDRLTAINAQEPLSRILRTTGRPDITPAELAAVCHAWAESAQRNTGLTTVESYAHCLMRIYQAEAMCDLPDFRLADFIRPFLSELYRLCPVAERERFKAELPQVRQRFEASMRAHSTRKMREFEVMTTTSDGRTLTEGELLRQSEAQFVSALENLQALVGAALEPGDRLEGLRPVMEEIGASFQNIIDERTLKNRLTRIAGFGLTLFNNGELEAANLVLGFIAAVVDRRKDQFLERDVASVITLDSLNQEVLSGLLADKSRLHLLKPLLSNIFETRPNSLLSRLATEPDAQARKQLLIYLTVYQPEIYNQILSELRQRAATKWFYMRNLLFLLTKMERPAGLPVAEVTQVVREYVHPEIHPNLVSEAVRTLLAIDAVAGLGLVLDLIEAEHVSQVIRVDRFYAEEELAAFLGRVADGAAGFDFTPYPSLVQRILDAAETELSRVRLKLGRVGVGFNQARFDRVVGMLAGSHSPRVVDALRQFRDECRLAGAQQTLDRVLEAVRQRRRGFM